MEQQLQRGQQVTVNAYRGRRPVVTVVEDRGDVILICKPGEYMTAAAEGRVPIVVGFHREDVLEVVTVSKKGAASETPAAYRGSKAGD